MGDTRLPNSNGHSFGWLLAGDDLGATVFGGLVIVFVVSDHDLKASGLVSEINSVGYSEAVAADRLWVHDCSSANGSTAALEVARRSPEGKAPLKRPGRWPPAATMSPGGRTCSGPEHFDGSQVGSVKRSAEDTPPLNRTASPIALLSGPTASESRSEWTGDGLLVGNWPTDRLLVFGPAAALVFGSRSITVTTSGSWSVTALDSVEPAAVAFGSGWADSDGAQFLVAMENGHDNRIADCVFALLAIFQILVVGLYCLPLVLPDRVLSMSQPSIMKRHYASTQFQRTCASFLHYFASFFDRFHLFRNWLLAWLVLVSLLDAVSETLFVFIVGGFFWTICMLTGAASLIRSRDHILNYAALLLLGSSVAVKQEPEFTLLASWRNEWNLAHTESHCTYSEDDGEHTDDVCPGGNSQAVTAAGAFCDVDRATRNIARHRDSVTPWSKCHKPPVLRHALGPGSPARQGAGHE
jgi:hypothetical protein